MIVRYDYQIFCQQEYGGISRYFYELITRLSSKPGIQVQLDVLASNNQYIKILKGNKGWNSIHFKGKKDLNRIVSSLYDAYAARLQPFDVFHPTYYNTASLKIAGGQPMVITIHDLIDEKFHSGDKKLNRLIENRKKHIAAATKIIAVSENTRNDLINLCGVAPEKIQTIYHGNTFNQHIAKASLPTKITTPYLLYTGKRFAYKNFTGMLYALQPLLKSNSSLQLICGGGGSFTTVEEVLLKQLGIEQQVQQIPIKTDEELASLYNNATVFIYPSLYEGFGLPILEAFANGCPVATASGSSTGEIAADAAVLFNAQDQASMHDSIQYLLNDEAAQLTYSQKGYERAQLFNWDKTAQQTLQLYQSL